MFWAIGLSIVFIVSVLFMLMRKPGVGNLWVHAFLIPGAASVFLIIAIVSILWGMEHDTRETIDWAGMQLSVEATRGAARAVGVGIITGVVAGALLGVVTRWHDWEKSVDWDEFIKQKFREEGFEVVELPGEEPTTE